MPAETLAGIQPGPRRVAALFASDYLTLRNLLRSLRMRPRAGKARAPRRDIHFTT